MSDASPSPNPWCLSRIILIIWMLLPLPVAAQGIEHTETLLQTGQRLYQQGNYEAAIPPLETALEQINAPFEQGMTWANLSLVYQGLGDWENAQNALSQAKLLIPQLSESSQKQRLQAQVAEVQGKLYFSLGQGENALLAWREATTAYQQQKDSQGVIRTQLHQSRALQHLGQFRHALKTLKPVIVQLSHQPNSLTKIQAWQELGTLIRVVGKVDGLPSVTTSEGDYLDQAEAILQHSLTLAQQLPHPETEAEILLSLGNTAQARYYQLKDEYQRVPRGNNRPPQQVNSYQNALNYYQQVIALNYTPLLTIKAQLNQLQLSLELATRRTEPKVAENAPNVQDTIEQLMAQFPRFLEQLQDLPQNQQSLNSQLNLMLNWLNYYQTISPNQLSENSQLLADFLQEINQKAQQINDSYLVAKSYYELSRLYQLSGSLSQAKYWNQKALLVAEREQDDYTLYQVQWQLAKLLTAEQKTAAAITAYEETIKTLDQVRYDLISLEKSDVRFLFRNDIEPVYRELLELLLLQEDSNKSQTQLSGYTRLEKAKNYTQKLQVAELEDYLRCQLQLANHIPLDQLIQKHQLKTTSIYSVVLPEDLVLLVKTPESPNLKYYSVEISKQELEKKVSEIRNLVFQGKESRNAQIYQELYNILIEPIEPALKESNTETLVFVLDSFLQNLPLAALYDTKSDQYLIEKYSLALNLGLNLLDESPLAAQDFNLLIGGLSESYSNSKPLPYVTQEVEQLTRNFPESQLLYNDEFTEENLQTTVNENPFPIVHLATHGQFSSRVEDTFLLAADQKINLNEMSQVIQRRGETFSQAIELLVLSACQTAIGDRRATLGLAGVTVQAGAVSTLASLFKIQDRSTSQLMAEFYQHLRQEEISKAEALRRAQLALLQNTETQKPYHWAPFVLVGNWR
ncbi:CHAT domain-containing protein [Spirulina sp. CS-785/01]|uniref:CHAT domain-containing protein n=1 Tax=Spirulina sp. CS-785/01 TaxID=3021716 RepID=UPI00232E0CFF|nr:CHAT domain-containing protein [Spirulina sp. CS-785/01]MDB9315422.1 CHAT domain-containing protein [Spirulina sp. CS-785/01]